MHLPISPWPKVKLPNVMSDAHYKKKKNPPTLSIVTVILFSLGNMSLFSNLNQDFYSNYRLI